MRSQIQTTILLLVGFLCAVSFAGCSGCSKRQNNNPWIGRRGLSLVKRDGRAKCGSTPGGAELDDRSIGTHRQTRRDILPNKRNLAPLPKTAHLALTKRTLEEFPEDDDDRDTFMVEHVNDADLDVVPDPVNGNDINSGQFRRIEGSDDRLTIGLGHKEVDGTPIRLTGCTALIVMSEKAVWFGHFWETLAYEDDEVFQKNVIDFINNGGTDRPDEQQSLKAHADDFKDQPGRSAWILYPEADEVIDEDGDTQEVDYKDMNTRLQQEVAKLTGITPTMVEYKPTDDNDKALGRSLYQYDPEAREEDDDEPVRGFRFIHEYKDEGIHYF